MANTKRALLTSALAIVACVAMLIGSTFAWFTDTASTGVNKIQAGNLDIKVEYTLDGGTWKDLDGATDIFQKGLWEPGHTEVVALRFKNNGSLALKYSINMNIVDENVGINKLGQKYKLSDYLKVKILSQEASLIGDICIGMAFSARNDGLAYTTTADLKDATVVDHDLLLPPGEVGNYLIMKVYMPETVGNEANAISTEKAASIDFGLNVVATQVPYEKDSFGNTYDKDATYPDVWDGTVSDDVIFTDKKAVVSTAADFAGAAKVAAANKDGDIQIDLENDLVMNAADWTSIKVDGYHGAGVLTIDGKGHTIKGLNAPLVEGGFAGSSGVVIKNLTIADSDISLPGVIGVGAFVATVDSMPKITLENCHLLNSKVSGERVGGLVGWTSGYNNPNDGPVDTTVTITDCSVVGSTIAATKSAGGIIGHAGANPATYHFITNCKVENVKLSGQYMGLLVGTANVGEVTADGNAVSGNVTKLVGRYALNDTGKVTINGEVCTDK